MSRDVKERERVGKLCPICCCDYLRVKASIERSPRDASQVCGRQLDFVRYSGRSEAIIFAFFPFSRRKCNPLLSS